MTRTATSPRFATRTRENIARGGPRTSLAMSDLEAASAAPTQPSFARLATRCAHGMSQRVERTSDHRLELEQELSEFDRCGVLDVDRADDAVDVRLDLVHQLHRLEDAECLPRADGLS